MAFQFCLPPLGICVPLQPFSLIYEYMPDGDLSSYLHRLAEANGRCPFGSDLAVSIITTTNNTSLEEVDPPESAESPPLSIAELLQFALDICEAMIYVSSRPYVHRFVLTAQYISLFELVIVISLNSF